MRHSRLSYSCMEKNLEYFSIFLLTVNCLLFVNLSRWMINPFTADDHFSTDESDKLYNMSTPKLIDTSFWEHLETIYVIPGGGSGIPLSPSNASRTKSKATSTGYPEWTRQRTIKAFQFHVNERTSHQREHAVFMALSAGSLNAPNLLRQDGRIVFECQHVIDHLLELGVPHNQLYGDYFSWDTVTNAFSVRMFIEAVTLFRRSRTVGRSKRRSKPIAVFVFIRYVVYLLRFEHMYVCIW